jgi:uncharacterized protein
MDSNDLNKILKMVQGTATFDDKAPIDVNTRGFFGDTPLHVAAVWGDVDAGKILLNAGADINARGEDGYTPLHEAVEQGKQDFVSLLLAHGAALHLRDDMGQTSFEAAETMGNAKIKQLLLEAEENRNKPNA